MILQTSWKSENKEEGRKVSWKVTMCHTILRKGEEEEKGKSNRDRHSAPDTSWHDLLNAIFLRYDLYNRRGKKKKEINRHLECWEFASNNKERQKEAKTRDFFYKMQYDSIRNFSELLDILNNWALNYQK